MTQVNRMNDCTSQDLMNPAETLTMTSVEIAELTKVRHDHVIEKIKELAGRGVIRTFPEIREKHDGPNKQGRPMQICRLNRDESINLVANLSPEFTQAIINRWLELEYQLRQKPYEELQALTVEMRVSQRLGQIGSQLMHQRRRDKRQHTGKEKVLVSQCQMAFRF